MNLKKSKHRLIPTANMSREEWLAQRKHTIGGSDAAGIVGLSKWSSPYSVWADKTGRLPDKEDTEAMRLGRDLEDYVAKRWMEATGKKCRRLNAMIYNSDCPFAHADIDREVIGENAGLECKTTSDLDVRQFFDCEFPIKYYCQCVHYMAVTGADRWYLAVLVFGKGFFTYCLERNEGIQNEIDHLMDAERDFWHYVASDTPPMADDSEATSDALGAIYADSAPGEIELSGKSGLLRERDILRQQKSEIEKRIRGIDNELKASLGGFETGVAGDWRVTWKPQERRTLREDLLLRDYPDIGCLKDYYETNTIRVLRVKKIDRGA